MAKSKQEQKTLWGGRFEAGPSPTFQQFSWSLHFDKRLLEADVKGSQAFARELERSGIVNARERAQLVKAFDEILQEAQNPRAFEGATDEDVHTFVIRLLKAKVGPLADRIHTGRSRNEQVSLDTRLWLRGEIDRIHQLLNQLMAALLNMAEQYSDAVVPGYTHLRRAQPVLFAHYLLSYFEMFDRDRERLQQTRRRVNVMPLGSGALAGSGFPIQREAIARDLGFASVTNNSMDVSGDRDFALDFLHSVSVIMLHLSRLSEDWILYSGEEFNWIELSDRVTSGSSLMPQKKNPDCFELIRGKCGRVAASYHSLFITMKGLPMTYNRDMQEDKEPLFDAVDQTAMSLAMATEAIATAKLKPEAPARAAEESWTVATDIAEELARRGTPFHQAHQLAGRLVLDSIQRGRLPMEITAQELEAFDPRLGQGFHRFLAPGTGMATRKAKGGTAPAAVKRALKEARRRLQRSGKEF
jgi:argininosuccinate lyase